jgi:hypothetical protein
VTTAMRWMAAAVAGGLAAGLPGGVPPAAAADPQPQSVVEDYAYPGADRILAEHGVKVLKGDGRIRHVSDCAGRTDVFRVESLVGAEARTYCFEVLGPRGFLTMDIPNVYLVRGADRAVVAKATYQGQTETVTVPPGTYEAIGGGNATHTLVELRVAGTEPLPAGTPGSHPYVAKLDTAGRGCSAVLLAPQWIATAKTCFAADGAVPAGPPPAPATVVVGRPDLLRSGGQERTVTEVVPRADRDLVLAKLSSPVTDITPVAVGTAAPATGEQVQAVGYGRTATGWPATELRTGAFTVTTVGAGTVGLARAAGTATGTCKGDAGGPTLRQRDGKPELVAVHSASLQAGCAGTTWTGDLAAETRLDDIATWIRQQTVRYKDTFAAVHRSTTGLGGYDLAVNRDQVVAFDYEHSGKLDHVVSYRPGDKIIFIQKITPQGTFVPVFTSFAGIAGYDLAVASDRIVAFDYDHSGKQDHLLIYRPGTRTVAIVRHNPDNSFGLVYFSTNGIGGYDLAVAADQVVAFDYEHTGKLDHLLAYRPGNRIAYVIKHNPDGGFSPVFTSFGGIGGFDLATTADRAIAFDYEHTGKQDHLLLYRPGPGSSQHVVFIVKHNADGGFSPVFTSFGGIGGYDLAVAVDQIIPFDYEHTGKLDHLVLYRPGWQTIGIVRHHPDHSFGLVSLSFTGIGGYDLASAADRITALDYQHSGGPDHLLLYRPAARLAAVAGREVA